MHIEILVEDSSGAALLEILLPKLLGEQGDPHTWKLHMYKGIGRLPKNLKPTGDPRKRILLDQIPRILRGYANTPGIDAVVVLVDSDNRECKSFLNELIAVAAPVQSQLKVLFRLAIEEMESWYLGDRRAMKCAYPAVRNELLTRYKQDSICGTWELLADAVHPGGRVAIKKDGWPTSGVAKHDWARKIGPFMDLESNDSVSFQKFRDGLRRLVARGER